MRLPFPSALGRILASGLIAVGLLASSGAGAQGVASDAAILEGLLADIGRLTAEAPAGYVGARACAACHRAEAANWEKSHHALAMTQATPQTVLGDFSGVGVSEFGAGARFHRDGEDYLVDTEGRDGKPATVKVTDTFGWTPLQQYLVTFPDGRRQVLPWAYDTRPREAGGQRWFHVYAQAIAAGDPLHWTGVLQTWNHMCAECHSTALEKGYDAARNTYHTTFSEVSIGCESCHGPGAGHLAWAQTSPRPDAPLKGFAAAVTPRPPVDWTPDPATGSPSASVARPAGDGVELCARCHSRRGVLSEHWVPGRPLADTHSAAVLIEGLFEADGQMRDEVFNDQAFKQSRMYARGVVCTDCHDPHSARLKAPGAQVCSQCHLPERFAAEGHTGHQPGPGAPDCISCHMPARTYMRVDVRHDHSFRIPRPDLTASLGVPNTCNACHADRSAQWAAEAIARRHGPGRKGFQTYAEAFALARRDDPAAREKLIALATDNAVPGVARATALVELQGFPSAAALAALVSGLQDKDPLVRVAALQSITGLPLAERWRRASPLLDDPVLGVRLAAARALADMPPDQAPGADGARLAAALRAYEDALALEADRPEGRLNAATYRMMRGDPAAAERELLAGLALEPGMPELVVNLADLYRGTGREAEAERALRGALALHPHAAALHHALGLSLARQQKLTAALAELGAAADAAPGDARYAYVHVVALRSVGDMAASRRALVAALARHPNDVELLGLALDDALAARDLAGARSAAGRLSRLRPDDAGIARLNERLRRMPAQ